MPVEGVILLVEALVFLVLEVTVFLEKMVDLLVFVVQVQVVI